jgi:hypothetical protein
MRPLVILAPDKRTEEEWTYSGSGREGGIAWERVYFQAEAEPGKWGFLQMQIGLNPDCEERSALAQQLSAELTKRLGKPEIDSHEHFARRSWTAKGGQMISIRDGEFKNPITNTKESVVLVEVAIAQGESD